MSGAGMGSEEHSGIDELSKKRVTVAQAAELMGVTRGTAYRRLRRLERETGQKILVRSPVSGCLIVSDSGLRRAMV